MDGPLGPSACIVRGATDLGESRLRFARRTGGRTVLTGAGRQLGVRPVCGRRAADALAGVLAGVLPDVPAV
ncbi:hypothetical protein [Streptomyces sp. CBMA123]|uniref:hypothetical protein n=1 Tax=Streptomyces sp. CBMA123 TaxID=1896313 RepID=UPI0016618A8C|nr:hypothetical protein [Streptomyces sp. CBMA123]